MAHHRRELSVSTKRFFCLDSISSSVGGLVVAKESNQQCSLAIWCCLEEISILSCVALSAELCYCHWCRDIFSLAKMTQLQCSPRCSLFNECLSHTLSSSPSFRANLPMPEKRNVIIQRDSRGYGIRISGDNPVSIESVNPGKICAYHSV